MSEKNTHIYFFYFWFKNKRGLAEKIGKNWKHFKNLKVAEKLLEKSTTRIAITVYINKKKRGKITLQLTVAKHAWKILGKYIAGNRNLAPVFSFFSKEMDNGVF